MNEGQHTPAPWTMIAEPELTIVIACDEPRINDKAFGIAFIPHHDGANSIDWQTKQANARLICAAPKLLESLRRMDALIDRLMPAVPWGKTFLSAEAISELNAAPIQAQRAIAEALGEAPPEAPHDPLVVWAQPRVAYERRGDMGPQERLSLMTDEDGDILLTVWEGDRPATIEFCTFQGGGQSPAVRLALMRLLQAIIVDNKERPQHRTAEGSGA